MSQNTPPNEPTEQLGSPDRESNGAPPGNPYFEQVQQDVPDLDAGAPKLRSAEEQRLNRKALVFLGGTLLLLVALAAILYKQATSEKKEVVKESSSKEVSVPSLPQVAERPESAPVARPHQHSDPIPLLPPAPTQVASRSSSTFVDRRDLGPTLVERRMAATGSSTIGMNGSGARSPMQEASESRAALMKAFQGDNQNATTVPKRGPDVDDVSNAKFINHPDALLVRGTYLRCVLETRIITDVQGYTSCLLTEPVYSINGRNLLLPKGSKIYGSYGGSPANNRVSVIWDRITTPNGIDVTMSSPGIDNLGGAGHPGQYNAHWAARISSALMISLISDAFKYAAAEYGPESTTVSTSGTIVTSPYESATARTMERLANEALAENMKRKATVTINQGIVVNIYVARDVDFTNVLAQAR